METRAPDMDTYEPPTLKVYGTVSALTEASLFGAQADSLTWIIPILGDPSS